jgi:hypothetical protein
VDKDHGTIHAMGTTPKIFLKLALCLSCAVLLAACRGAPFSTPVQTQDIASLITLSSTSSSTPAPTRTHTPSLTPTKAPTNTATVTETPTATYTETPTPQPTFMVLRGVVNVEHVSCFYGPSKAYLYKYGLLGGNRLDILGIMLDTQYIEVRAIGGDNPCWMNLQWMDVQGDINTVRPIDPLDVVLPWSPYYAALTGVAASRTGNTVTISWNPLSLRAGDDSEQEPYLVETWVCQNGRLTFVPIGAYQTQTSVEDEPGCDQPSHGRVYGVEKHGYTRYIEIPWP